jgi:hypothetical protein
VALSPLYYGAFVVVGLTVLGASAGVAVLVSQEGIVTGSELVALFVVAMFLASVMGAQMYRRDLEGSTLVGALAGGLSVLAFFAVPFYVLTTFGYAAPSARVVGMFLGVAPIIAFGMSGAGTMVLAGGVKRYRERFGMVHAPRQG